MIYHRICVALLPMVLVACATTDPEPVEQLRLTEQALAQSSAVGVTAENSPTMRMAEEKLEKARAASLDGEFKQARIYAEQAELDARLAEVEHLREKSEQQLLELRKNNTALRKQLGGLK